MNKLIITLVTTLLLTSASTAFSQDFSQDSAGEPGRKGPRGQRGMQGMPITTQVMRAVKHLDLSEEQRSNIKTVLQELKTEIRPIMMEVKAGQNQLRDLIKAESYDANAVAAVAEKEGQLAAERIVLTGEALSKVFGYLTEEQRLQLDAMAAKRKNQRAQKQERRAGEG